MFEITEGGSWLRFGLAVVRVFLHKLPVGIAWLQIHCKQVTNSSEKDCIICAASVFLAPMFSLNHLGLFAFSQTSRSQTTNPQESSRIDPAPRRTGYAGLSVEF